jgi:hypothetical protein
MEAAAISPDAISALKAADTVTAVAGGSTERIDLSSFSGDQEIAFAIVGNGLNNQLTGGSSHDSITGQVANDVITGGGGNDTVSGGTGNDVFVFSTTQLKNGQDLVNDFGDGTDQIDFQFNMLGETVQSDLRGDGTGIQFIPGAPGTVELNTGLLIITGETANLDSGGVSDVLDGILGMSDGDVIFLAFSDSNGDTGIFRVSDNAGDGWTHDNLNVELFAVLDNYIANNLNDYTFVDFSVGPA